MFKIAFSRRKGRLSRPCAIVLLLIGIAAGWYAAPLRIVHAAAIVVNTLVDDDGSHCSLRSAIEATNIHKKYNGCNVPDVGPNTIAFAVSGSLQVNPMQIKIDVTTQAGA